MRYYSSGRYVQHFNEAVDYTFIPAPLSAGITLEFDGELPMLLAKANRLLGQLEGISRLLPNMEAVISIMVTKEAFLSCQIDGIKASFFDVLSTSGSPKYNVRLVKNCASAIQYNTRDGYSNVLLCDLHEKIMKGTETDNAGSFRTIFAWIGQIRLGTKDPSYNPTAPENINDAMQDIEYFLKRNHALDALIKLALVHYQFEAIHPFVSGNGRIGRIIPYIILKDSQVLVSPVFTISEFLLENKAQYFDCISVPYISLEYERWISFFLHAIIAGASASLDSTERWLKLREKNIKKIQSVKSSPSTVYKIYTGIERHSVFNIEMIAEYAEVSYNTAASVLKAFMKLKIITQLNDTSRNRIYCYPGFIDCFVDKKWHDGVG